MAVYSVTPIALILRVSDGADLGFDSILLIVTLSIRSGNCPVAAWSSGRGHLRYVPVVWDFWYMLITFTFNLA